MKRRIFIAINLPENIKKRIWDFQNKWESLPVRWTKRDSLHLTLIFIGYVDDEEMLEVCRLTREVAQKNEPFFIDFEKILYGPPQNNQKPPRMIWLKGRPSDELIQIRKELEENLISSEGVGNFNIEKHPFSPHITLARVKIGQWRNLSSSPEVEQDFKASLAVNSIDVMESELKRDGAEYTILESCPLGG